MKTCNSCGQPLPEIRLGVTLTPLKARIFDIVRRSGQGGIERDDLYRMIYPDAEAGRATLKSHIWQINDLLADEGYRITGGTVARLERTDRQFEPGPITDRPFGVPL